MKYSILTLMGLCLLSTSVLSQGAQLQRGTSLDGTDTPTSPLRLVIPARDGSLSPDLGTMPDEEYIVELPVDPLPPPSPPPTFYGEAVSGRVIIILDFSSSMRMQTGALVEDLDGNIIPTPSRADKMKEQYRSLIAELKALSQTQNVFVEIILFPNTKGPDQGSGKPGDKVIPRSHEAVWLFGALKEAGIGVLDIALDWVVNHRASGKTPMYPALDQATHKYGTDVDKILLLCDGGANFKPEELLNEFSAWFAPLKANGCKFTAINIGNQGHVYMQLLANSVGGTYIEVDA